VPIFELSADELARPNRLTLSRLENIMLWPGSPDRRSAAAEAAAAALVRDHIRSLPEVVTTGADVAAVLEIAADAPRMADVQPQAKEAFRRGLIAGRIVHDVIGWREVNSTMAGLQQAKRRIARTCKISISQIENDIWKPYRDVAPFWAAYYTLAKGERDMPFPCSTKQLSNFFGISKYYLRMGSIRGKQAPVNMFNETTVWQLPGDLIIAEVSVSYSRSRNSSTAR
jgi:hypothetical protein